MAHVKSPACLTVALAHRRAFAVCFQIAAGAFGPHTRDDSVLLSSLRAAHRPSLTDSERDTVIYCEVSSVEDHYICVVTRMGMAMV